MYCSIKENEKNMWAPHFPSYAKPCPPPKTKKKKERANLVVLQTHMVSYYRHVVVLVVREQTSNGIFVMHNSHDERINTWVSYYGHLINV